MQQQIILSKGYIFIGATENCKQETYTQKQKKINQGMGTRECNNRKQGNMK